MTLEMSSETKERIRALSFANDALVLSKTPCQ